MAGATVGFNAYVVNRLTGASTYRSGTTGSPQLSNDGRLLAFVSPHPEVAGDTNGTSDAFVRNLFDHDGDTMTNDWESFFGLNPEDASDASGDLDGDGATNAQEFADGTHPNGLASATRHFAEGAATSFFDTRIAVANPGSLPAHVLFRFLRPTGAAVTHLMAVPPKQTRKLLVDTLPALSGAEFATLVESDRDMACRLSPNGPCGGRAGTAPGSRPTTRLASPNPGSSSAWQTAKSACRP